MQVSDWLGAVGPIGAQRDGERIDYMISEHAIALKIGHELKEYVIESVLGEGGFGITYLARQTVLNKRFAIKEFLPREIATRTDGITVRPISSKSADDFAYGLDRFIKEARLLASFRHPNIVQVQHFFEENGTAYLVMDYEEGESLSTILKQHGALEESELREILFPLLDGLTQVHRAGVLHRDIKPGNIFIRKNGSPLLLDFGAARNALGAHSRSLTSIVTPGYAPYEQYYGAGEQGPATDIYALGATLYSAVTGDRPLEAPSRIREDALVPCTVACKGRYRPHFLEAIDAALAVDAEDRPQDVATWRSMFEAKPEARATTLVPDAKLREQDDTPPPTPGVAPQMNRGVVWTLVVVLVLGLAGGGGYLLYRSQKDAERLATINALLTSAERAIDGGRLTRPPEENAAAIYRQVLDLDPGNARAKRGLDRIAALLVARADKLTAERNFNDADAELKEAERINPGYGDLEAARARLESAIEKARTAANKAKVKALVQQADQALRRQDFERAETRLKDAEQILPDSPDVAAARRRLSDARQRAAAADKVKDLVRRSDQAVGRRDFDTAQRHLDEAARILPNSPDVKAGRERLAAARAARSAANQRTVRRLIRQADRALRKGDFDGAKKSLEEADKVIPGHPDIASARARIAEAVRKDAQARAAEAKVRGLVKSADAAIARKEFDRAESLLAEADKLAPRHSSVRAARRRLAEAKAAADAEAADAQVRALVRQADAAIKAKQFDRADSLLDQAARLDRRHRSLRAARRRLAAAKAAAAGETTDARVRALVRQADSAIRAKQFDRADSLLDQAARLDRRHRSLRAVRRRLAAAKAAAAGEATDAQVRALVRQADAAIKAKKFDRADSLLDQAARLNRRHRSVRAARRRLAAAKAAAAGETTDAQVRALVRQADSAIKAKQFDRADSLLDQAARLDRRHRSLRAARRRLAAAKAAASGRTAGIACASSVPSLNRFYSARSDCVFVRRAFLVTLSRPITGVVSRWTNSRTGVSGTITVLRTFSRGNGVYCRRFRQTVASNGRVRQGVGTACLRNNVWRMAGS